MKHFTQNDGKRRLTESIRKRGTGGRSVEERTCKNIKHSCLNNWDIAAKFHKNRAVRHKNTKSDMLMQKYIRINFKIGAHLSDLPGSTIEEKEEVKVVI